MRGAHARLTSWFDTDIDLSIRMQHCQDGSLMRQEPTTKTVLEPPRQHHPTGHCASASSVGLTVGALCLAQPDARTAASGQPTIASCHC